MYFLCETKILSNKTHFLQTLYKLNMITFKCSSVSISIFKSIFFDQFYGTVHKTLLNA